MMGSYPHVIENGGGERLTFLGVRRGEDGHGYLDVTNEVKPGSGPPFHVHYLQQETITVTEGRVGYQVLGGPERFAGSGETVTFAPGQIHRFWNAGTGVLKCRGAASPPLNFEYFLTELFASMQRAGGRNPSPLDMAFLLGRYRTEFGVGMIPAPVQKFVFPVMRVIGRVTGSLPAVRGRTGTRGSACRYAITEDARSHRLSISGPDCLLNARSARTRQARALVHPIWNLYFRFARAAWGQGFAAEAAREAVIVAAERDPRRRVVVRPRPGNDAAQLLTSRIGLARAPELDADGFVTFVSRGPSPRFQLRTRLLAGTAEGRALRG